MSVTDDLKQVATDLNTAQAAVEQVVNDLETPAPSSAADSVLAAAVSALEAAGYTVTPPTPAEPTVEASV